MEQSSRQIWSARLLALLLMAIGVTLIITVLKISYGNYDSQITIWTNDKEKVVAAVEGLGLADVKINSRDIVESPEWLFMAKAVVSVFVGLGFCLGIYYAIYCVVNAFLFGYKKDEGLLDQL